ncbi:MAG: histidine kinase [Siphonobacter aquaeclarae]|nr:histidine kinase [Siphonobacter aquaeclarae]
MKRVLNFRRLEMVVGLFFLLGGIFACLRDAIERSGIVLRQFRGHLPEYQQYTREFFLLYDDFLPEIAVRVGILGAWAIVHFYVVPSFRKQPWRSILAFFGAAAVYVAGQVIFLEFRKVPEVFMENGEIAYTFAEREYPRIVDDFVVVFSIILYEIGAQVVYRLLRRESRYSTLLAWVLFAGYAWLATIVGIHIFDILLTQFWSGLLVFSLPCWYTCLLVLLFLVFPRRDWKTPIWVGIYLLVAAAITLVASQMINTVFNIRSLFWVWLVHWAVACSLVYMIGYWLYRKLEEGRALRQTVQVGQAELASLKAQINPHFLFNALNTLYASALQEQAETTAEGIQKLGDMMRFMLHDNARDLIHLSRELDYLREYIHLQRLRLPDTIDIQVTMPEEACPMQIPPLLLVPFVENAFKHGISLRQPSWVFVRLECRPEAVVFEVQNSLHAKQENDPESAASGIGLENVRKRLELLLPDRYELQIHETRKEYSIHLELKRKA